MLTTMEGYRISPKQKRIWAMGEVVRHEASLARVMIGLEGDVERGLLEAALQKVAARHAVLRTTFHVRPGEALPLQNAADELQAQAPWREREFDWQPLSQDEQQALLDRLFADFPQHVFHLEEEPLLQAEWVTLAADKQVLLTALPASLIDCAIQPFVHELALVYAELAGSAADGDEEAERLQVDWNRTGVLFSKHQALHRLFEEQAAKTPHHIAVLCGEQTLTYRELNNRANCLARELQTHGMAAGKIAAIACKRSLEMIVGMLAVLKAGGAYLPLDLDYPEDRIAYMLQHSQAEVLLTQQEAAGRFERQEMQVILLDDPDRVNSAAEAWDDLDVPVSGEHPAYVIYTSGSTGQPKGIVIGHGAICNHMQWMQAEFPLGASDRVLQKTAFSFDASVWEFYAPLLAGAQLVFAKPDAHLDPAALVQEIREQRVTTLQVVPTMLSMLLEQADFAACTSLRRVFAGGEQLTRQLQERLFDSLPHAELINLYGPTECCIDSTYWVAERGGSGHAVPIGRPIANVQVYVLDEDRQPVPQGVAGELYIGGAGLALGYLHAPELTAERFVAHPYAAGGRLYKTGDLVRMLPGGALEFLGRIDDQVKLRGLRIELGEIEAALQHHETVQQAVVLLREDKPGEQLLVAYVVSNGEPPEIQELRQLLTGQLPDYMVPSCYVFLNVLPLLPNGKVDRRQLPEPDRSALGNTTSYVAPRSGTEELIAGVWSEILGHSEVGVRHDFFELGGDSLAALKIVALCKRGGIILTPQDLFKLRRIEEIAAALEARTQR